MRCRWCGWIVPHFFPVPENVLREHVATCELSIPCDYCGANQRERCTTVMGNPAPFHEPRRF